MDWRNENDVELGRLKDTKHLITQLPLKNVIIEPKINGRRYSLEVGPFDHETKLISRSRHDKTKGVEVSRTQPFVDKVPEDWMATLATNGAVHVFDGELCTLSKSNASSSGRKVEPKKYIIWDLLVFNGEDIRAYPLEKRLKLLASAIKDIQGIGIHRLEHIDHELHREFTPRILESYLRQIREEKVEGYVVKELWRSYDHLRYGWKIKVKDNADGYIVDWKEESKHHYGEKTQTGRVGTVAVAQLTGKVSKGIKEQEIVAWVALPEENRCDIRDGISKLFSKVLEFSHLGWDGERFMFPQFVRWRDDKSIHDCTFSN